MSSRLGYSCFWYNQFYLFMYGITQSKWVRKFYCDTITLKTLNSSNHGQLISSEDLLLIHPNINCVCFPKHNDKVELLSSIHFILFFDNTICNYIKESSLGGNQTIQYKHLGCHSRTLDCCLSIEESILLPWPFIKFPLGIWYFYLKWYNITSSQSPITTNWFAFSI